MNADPLYMLDSDICIFVLRNAQPSVLARFEQTVPGEAVISTITYGELFHGALKSQSPQLQIQKLKELTLFVPVEPMPVECGEHFGRIRSDLERRGMIIGSNDMWIAAHALALNLTLVTNNIREFNRIPGLNVENWV